MRPLKLAVIMLAVALCGGGLTACNNADAPPAGTNANTSVPVPAATAATAAAAAAPDELAAAREIYRNACARCHQENGEGGAIDFDGTKLRVPSFKKGHALNHTDAQFARQISNGGDGMPAFKSRLSEAQINDLVRFVRREFQAGLVPDAEQPGAATGEHK